MLQSRNRIEQNMINLLQEKENAREELQFDMEFEEEGDTDEEPLTPFQLFNELDESIQNRYWKYMRMYSSIEPCCKDGLRNCMCRGWGSMRELLKLHPRLKGIYL